jgi:hypothetical protein
MAIDLNKSTGKKVTGTARKYKTPKSIRLQQSGLQQLEDFKNKLREITKEEFCSDTQAFKVLLNMTRYVNEKTLKKAISDIL